ncbi:MAG: GHKL domain-containing protein [Catonella sp.]
MSLINLVFIIINVLGVYTVYKLMGIFCGNETIKNKKVLFLSYFVYYLLSCVIFIYLNIPIVLLIFNFLIYFIISLNYKVRMKKRLMAIIYTYLIQIIVEVPFIISANYIGLSIFEKTDLRSMYLIISVRLFTYLVVIILDGYMITKREETDIPFSSWIGIVSVPVVTLILLILFLNIATSVSKIEVILAVSLIVTVNITNYFLYNSTLSIMRENNRRAIIEQQNEYYVKQFDMIRENINNVERLKHDMKNHIFMLKSLYDNKKKYEYEEYFEEILREVEGKEKIINSGNVIVDSILNYKLESLRADNVELSVNINIPAKMEVSDFDLTTILGNLLDNAIRAVKETEENKYLNIDIQYKSGRLIIWFVNSYKHIEKSKIGNYFISTKEDKNKHGIGQISIERTVDKYDGIIDVKYGDKKFETMIILYC